MIHESNVGIDESRTKCSTSGGLTLPLTGPPDSEPKVEGNEQGPLGHQEANSAAKQSPMILEQKISDLADQIKRLEESHGRLLGKVGQLGLEESVLSSMHEQSRALGEQHHEREVLFPMFRVLIGMADRCRTKIGELRALLKGYAKESHLDVALSIRHVMEARKADLVEIEALLATFGVESYEHLHQRFEPQTQKCIKRILSPHEELRERIARRLQPGYRRDGKVVRPEYVAVFVYSNSSRTQS